MCGAIMERDSGLRERRGARRDDGAERDGLDVAAGGRRRRRSRSRELAGVVHRPQPRPRKITVDLTGRRPRVRSSRRSHHFVDRFTIETPRLKFSSLAPRVVPRVRLARARPSEQRVAAALEVRPGGAVAAAQRRERLSSLGRAHAAAAERAAEAAEEEEGDRAHEHGRPVPVEPALPPAPVVGSERHPQRGAARIQRGRQVWQPRQQVGRSLVVVKPRAHAQRRARHTRPVGRERRVAVARGRACSGGSGR